MRRHWRRLEQEQNRCGFSLIAAFAGGGSINSMRGFNPINDFPICFLTVPSRRSSADNQHFR